MHRLSCSSTVHECARTVDMHAQVQDGPQTDPTEGRGDKLSDGDGTRKLL
jgi:IMP cyclohydrolase